MDHSLRGYLERRTLEELEEILKNAANYSEEIVRLVLEIKKKRIKQTK